MQNILNQMSLEVTLGFVGFWLFFFFAREEKNWSVKEDEIISIF